MSHEWYTSKDSSRIRIHNPPVSQSVVDAVSYVVDQMRWRQEEWGIQTNYKEGMQSLAIAAIHEEDLQGQDLEDFVKELKSRRYGLEYEELSNI